MIGGNPLGKARLKSLLAGREYIEELKMSREYDYGIEFETIWGDLKDKRDGRKAAAYKIFLRTKKIREDYIAALNSCIDVQKEYINKVSNESDYYKFCQERLSEKR